MEKRSNSSEPLPDTTLVMDPEDSPPDDNDDENGGDTLPPSFNDKTVNLKDVPTTLEGLITGEEGKNAHQILGTLVEADAKEIDAILGRTIIKEKDSHYVITINRALHLARHGIGGPLDHPRPWMSQYILGIVRTLPSLGGKSREQLVAGFQSAQEMLRRKEEEALKKREGNA